MEVRASGVLRQLIIHSPISISLNVLNLPEYSQLFNPMTWTVVVHPDNFSITAILQSDLTIGARLLTETASGRVLEMIVRTSFVVDQLDMSDIIPTIASLRAIVSDKPFITSFKMSSSWPNASPKAVWWLLCESRHTSCTPSTSTTSYTSSPYRPPYSGFQLSHLRASGFLSWFPVVCKHFGIMIIASGAMMVMALASGSVVKELLRVGLGEMYQSIDGPALDELVVGNNLNEAEIFSQVLESALHP
uniref:Uncharacterized protein n=1 Tax=Moniliophthora roreri TaxID=221103 RepID=A0A0W0G8F6_MONRR